MVQQASKSKDAKIQRTPAFAHALILSALSENGKPEALGGFTDVGRHTGSEARETCWPLVREIIKVGTHAIVLRPAPC